MGKVQGNNCLCSELGNVNEKKTTTNGMQQWNIGWTLIYGQQLQYGPPSIVIKCKFNKLSEHQVCASAMIYDVCDGKSHAYTLPTIGGISEIWFDL